MIDKALESLGDVSRAPSFMGGNPKYYFAIKSEIPFMQDINTIKQALLKAQEQEKTLEVIKKVIKNGFLHLDKDYIIIDSGNNLTEEEFKLFKEEFENVK